MITHLKSITSFICILNSFISDAQFSIIPLYIGQTGTYCAYEKPYQKTPYFNKWQIPDFSLSSATFGVFVKTVRFTPKINLYTGIYHGMLSWGYWVNDPVSGIQSGSATGGYIYKFPLFINLFDRNLGDETNESKKRTIGFRSYLGASYDFVPYGESYWNTDEKLIPGGSSDKETVRLITSSGSSLMGGCSFFIFNKRKRKETFSLSILYWQGLINLVAINVDYYTLNHSGHAKLFSRGTSLDVVLGYTINLNFKEGSVF